jgi:hypothetical protein
MKNVNALLTARYHAEIIARDLHAAYWVGAADKGRADHLFASAKSALADLHTLMAQAEGESELEVEPKSAAVTTPSTTLQERIRARQEAAQ